ncbi:MAG: hypothetical protein HOY71_13780 [Nonomuraea sp.]|nr:hypothetical protein [Nonomuraea sp.]
MANIAPPVEDIAPDALLDASSSLLSEHPDKDRLFEQLAISADRAAVAGAADTAVGLAALAVQVLEEIGGEPARLGTALAALGRLEYERGNPDLEPLERAADLCDDLDEPVVSATAYAYLGAALVALDRPGDALAAVSWSLAEQERVLRVQPELRPTLKPVRAEADRARGLACRALGRAPEAMDYLARAVEAALPRTPAQRLKIAEAATLLVEDLLAEERPEEAMPYAEIAITALGDGFAVKAALGRQRLIRCHLMAGGLAAAHPLIEALIEEARAVPGDLTFRAVLADSLAQSAELLPLLAEDGGERAAERGRESVAIYDELLAAGVEAEGVHTGRAAAALALAYALELCGKHADAVAPLREAVDTLERYAPGNEQLTGYLARALLMLGDALVESGQAMEAAEVLRRATELEPVTTPPR